MYVFTAPVWMGFCVPIRLKALRFIWDSRVWGLGLAEGFETFGFAGS